MASEFNPTNMVMVTCFDQELSLPAVAELLTCIPFDFTFGCKHNSGSRVKVPYFGVEGAIASVRYNMKSRGVRVGGGQLRNVVSIDIQCGGKNSHIKISKCKFLVTGVLSEEMGIQASNMCLEHLKMVNDHWKHYHSLTQECKDATLRWLCETVYIPEDDGLRKYSSTEVCDAFAMMPNTVDRRTATYLSMFTHDFTTYTGFLQKLQTLINIQPFATGNICYDNVPHLNSHKIHNSVYNYKMGFRVSLIKLCQHLHQKGYGAQYHNWATAKSLHVMIPLKEEVEEADIEEADDETHSEDEVSLPDEFDAADTVDDIVSYAPQPSTSKKKISAHRFQIYQSGAIRQTSPTSCTIASHVRSVLVEDIMSLMHATSNVPS